MADESPLLSYRRLGDNGVVRIPWYKNPMIYVWPIGGLLFIGLIAAAVVVSKADVMRKPDCRKSVPFAVFTEFSHPQAALSNDLCGNSPMLLLFGGKGKQDEAFDE